MLRRTQAVVVTLVILGAIAACGGGGGGPSAEEIAELEEVATRVVEAGPEEAAFFIEHTTLRGKEILGGGGEDCDVTPENCVQDSPPIVLNTFDTVIEGDRASTNVTIDGRFVFNLAFIKEDGVWKANEIGFSERIPERVTAIEITALDHEFVWDPADVTARNVAFSMTNDGDVEHGIAVGKLAEDFDLDSLVATLESDEFFGAPDDDQFAGIEFVGEASGGPGTTVNLVFSRDLEPGDYILMDRGVAEDGTSFVAMGMYTEFSVP